jgi:cytochrome o ubiquinol oxidase operon protein cyoD
MSDHHPTDAARGSLRSYTVGYLLALLLTAAPFALVMSSERSHAAVLVLVAAFAVLQIVVHLVFFLHLSRASSQRWNLVVLAYTAVILAILVGASVWIMYHLNYNMMP